MILQAFFRERAERVAPIPLLNGHQVMIEFALPPGPRVGELLEALREAQAVGEVNTQDQAWQWLRDRMTNHAAC